MALPEPDPDSAAHSARVAARLADVIRTRGGRISFAEFMHEVLYAPGLGYYAAGARKFGAAGDFVTAPEVSPVFGRVLARQLADVLERLDSGSILELGAGTGRLAADVLAKLADLDALPDQYCILEVSPDLRDRQEALLIEQDPELARRVVWLDALPVGHRGAIIANEVLDALPVERFRRSRDGVMQIGVMNGPDGFAFDEQPAGEALAAAVLDIECELGQPLPDGYVSDVCLAMPAWVTDVAAALSEGVVFLFDYGVSRSEYYAPERNGGWLRCHFRHHAHNAPLILPGIQDITAWVDFTAAATAATEAGLDVAGYATQAHFLLNGGLADEIADELANLANLPASEQLALSSQVKTLTLPGEMGEHFKCLGLRRGEIATPAALGAIDRTATL